MNKNFKILELFTTIFDINNENTKLAYKILIRYNAFMSLFHSQFKSHFT